MARRAQKSSEEQIARDWRNVALLPLSDAQIKQMAIREGVDDPDALLADIRQRNAEEFVRRHSPHGVRPKGALLHKPQARKRAGFTRRSTER